RVELGVKHQIAPSDSFGDEDIQVRIHVSNRSSEKVGNVEILESIPNTIKIEKGVNHGWGQLRASEELDFPREFHSPIRGRYELGPLVARARDPFGFYLVEASAGVETLSIMPRPERIRGAELRPRHLGPWPGTIPARTLGPGTEFYSMRSYVAGDDPKR